MLKRFRSVLSWPYQSMLLQLDKRGQDARTIPVMNYRHTPDMGRTNG
jgi:hypothetical protein